MEIEHTLIPREELEVFKLLPRIKTVVDVGARADTDYLEIHPNIELHAFEPNPSFFQQLTERVAQVATEKSVVYLNNYGLGDIPGKFMYNSNYQAFVEGEAPCVDGHGLLEIGTLDAYVEEFGMSRIDFLKIDVEGYDFKVLLGGEKTIPMCRFIQYEHWDEKQQYHTLLGDRFDMEYIGYRNVLCMNKKLVSEGVREKLRRFIRDNNYAALS